MGGGRGTLQKIVQTFPGQNRSFTLILISQAVSEILSYKPTERHMSCYFYIMIRNKNKKILQNVFLNMHENEMLYQILYESQTYKITEDHTVKEIKCQMS